MNVLRKKEFLKFYCGGVLISGLGSVIYNFIVGWYLLETTNSAMVSGVYLFFSNLLYVIVMMFFAGNVADKFSRKKIMYVTDFLSTIILLIMFIGIINGWFNVVVGLIITSSLLKMLSGFLFVASKGLVSNIVSEEELVKANGLLEGSYQIINVVGIALAGVLFSFLSIETFIFINMISFAISGMIEMTIKVKESYINEEKEIDGGAEQEKHTFLDNIKMVIKIPYMIQLTTVAMVINGAFALLFNNLYPYIINVIFNQLPIFLSASSIFITGVIFMMTTLVTKKNKKVQIDIVLSKCVRALLIGGLIVLVFGMTSIYFMNFSLYMISIFVGNFFLVFRSPELNINSMAYIMKEVDDGKRGRVLGVLGGMATFLTPFSMLLGGIGIEYLGVDFMCGIVVLLLFSAFIVNYHFTKKDQSLEKI